MTTTAKIAAKGCSGTGITEDLADSLHDQLGKTIVAVVELTAEARSEKRNGDESVVLTIGTIEVAPNGMTADHLRDLARSFHYERRLAEDGPTLTADDDDIEPKVTDVLAAGERFKPHPYLASGLSLDDDAQCDLCGQVESYAVHDAKARTVDTIADDELPDPDEQECGVSYDHDVPSGETECRTCGAEIADDSADTEPADPDNDRVISFTGRR